LDIDLEVGLDLGLADELGEGLRTHGLVGRFEHLGFAGDQAGHLPSSCSAALIRAGISGASPSRWAACSTARRATGSATPRPIRAATASPAAVGRMASGPARSSAWKAATGPSVIGL